MTKISEKTDLDLWHERMDAAIAESAAREAKKQADEKAKTATPSPPVIDIVSGTIHHAPPTYTADEIMNEMRRMYDAPPPPLPPEPSPSNPFDMTGASWRRNLIDAPPDEVMATLNERRIHHHQRPEFPPAILSCRDAKIGVLGEIAIVAGKKKSGKSHVIAAMVAGYVSGKKTMPLGFTGAPPSDRAGVLYFDTEMSAADVWIQSDRIKRLGEISDHEMMSMVSMYHLRRFNAAERLKLIDTAIREKSHECGLVVIDGIRDLLMDINSSTESQIVLSDLMRWTDEHHVCVVTAIHYNETGDTAKMRGHLGTELGNKGFSMIETSYETKNEYFAIKTPMSRKKRMDGDIGWKMVEYDINEWETGTLPIELDAVEYQAFREANKPVNRNSRHTKTMADELEFESHYDLIEKTFSTKADGLMRWGEILVTLRNVFFQKTRKELAKDRAEMFRDHWRSHGYICHGAGTPYTKSSRWRIATPDEVLSGMFIDGIPMKTAMEQYKATNTDDDSDIDIAPAPEPPSLYHENDDTETVD